MVVESKPSFSVCHLFLQARALAAQAAETDQIRFLVGTQSLRQENQVPVLITSM